MKADPSRGSFGSPGAGTLPHFFGLLFGRAAGVELRHVPYKGSAATLTDLAAGHVPMVVTTLSDFVEMHKAKRIRILATSGAARSPFVPDVPTFREAGFDIEGTSWFGAFAPARTPRETVDRYSTIMAGAVRMPDVRAHPGLGPATHWHLGGGVCGDPEGVERSHQRVRMSTSSGSWAGACNPPAPRRRSLRRSRRRTPNAGRRR